MNRISRMNFGFLFIVMAIELKHSHGRVTAAARGIRQPGEGKPRTQNGGTSGKASRCEGEEGKGIALRQVLAGRDVSPEIHRVWLVGVSRGRQGGNVFAQSTTSKVPRARIAEPSRLKVVKQNTLRACRAAGRSHRPPSRCMQTSSLSYTPSHSQPHEQSRDTSTPVLLGSRTQAGTPLRKQVRAVHQEP